MISDKKINILQIVTGLGKGGAERVLLDICKYINSENYNVFVFAFGNKSDLLETYVKENVSVKFITASNVLSIFGLLKILKRFSKEKKIDLIHAHLFHALFISVILNILCRLKFRIIFTAHSINIESKFREIILWCLKPFRQVDIIFSERRLKFYEKGKVQIIANGINTALYDLNKSKYQKFIFLSIGRLEYVKNHFGLLESIKNVKTDTDYEVWILGEGYLYKELEDKINKENLSHCVKLMGYNSDIINICNRSHCFLMHSLWEGLPIALLEAGATGLPVISTPVGSIPDLIHEETGYLSPIEHFGNVMSYVLENYDEAKKKGQTLQKLIQSEYDVKTMVRKHEDLYHQIMSS